eukprot:7452033-Alexandrium_andersonii.AAC.1
MSRLARVQLTITHGTSEVPLWGAAAPPRQAAFRAAPPRKAALGTCGLPARSGAGQASASLGKPGRAASWLTQPMEDAISHDR